MRLTLQLLGLELDVTLGPATEAEPETKRGPGDSLSIPIGFTASVALNGMRLAVITSSTQSPSLRIVGGDHERGLREGD